jgi:hypothetical protein
MIKKWTVGVAKGSRRAFPVQWTSTHQANQPSWGSTGGGAKKAVNPTVKGDACCLWLEERCFEFMFCLRIPEGHETSKCWRVAWMRNEKRIGWLRTNCRARRRRRRRRGRRRRRRRSRSKRRANEREKGLRRRAWIVYQTLKCGRRPKEVRQCWKARFKPLFKVNTIEARVVVMSTVCTTKWSMFVDKLQSDRKPFNGDVLEVWSERSTRRPSVSTVTQLSKGRRAIDEPVTNDEVRWTPPGMSRRRRADRITIIMILIIIRIVIIVFALIIAISGLLNCDGSSVSSEHRKAKEPVRSLSQLRRTCRRRSVGLTTNRFLTFFRTRINFFLLDCDRIITCRRLTLDILFDENLLLTQPEGAECKKFDHWRMVDEWLLIDVQPNVWLLSSSYRLFLSSYSHFHRVRAPFRQRSQCHLAIGGLYFGKQLCSNQKLNGEAFDTLKGPTRKNSFGFSNPKMEVFGFKLTLKVTPKK